MKTWIINLDRRYDKWIYMRKELERVDILATNRFSGIDTKPGWRGCRDSHMQILEANKNEPQLMVLEDDCKFLEDTRYIDIAMRQLPPDWDILYLGCSPRQPQEAYSRNLFRIKNAVCLHAYIITNHNGCIDYVLEHRQEIKKIDDFFATVVQEKFNCFCVYPLLVTQLQFSSDTCSRSDVSTIEKNFTTYCK